MKKKKLLRKNLLLGVVFMLIITTLWGCGTKESDKEIISEEQTVSEGETNQAEDAASNNSAEEETESASDEEGISEDAVNQDELTAALVRHKYNGVLSQLTCALQLPEGDMIEAPYESNAEMAENTYAITDIDGDGYEELIIDYSTASMAGMFTVIYGYNPETDTLTQELISFPSLTFYDNGIVKEDASHNHSYGEFWPFELYQYDAGTDSYLPIGYVDSWSKELSSTYYDYSSEQEIPFPDDLDTDQDGILYNIQEGDPENYTWNYEDYHYNEADFQKWYDSHLNNAKEITLKYQPIDSDNFTVYTKNYLDLIQKNKEAADPSTGTDIGIMFVTGDSSLQEVSEMLADHYGISIEQPYEDFEDEWIGKYQGQEVFDFINLNAGCIGYKDVQVEDITIFDLYPGMPEEEARRKIESYGFYLLDGSEENGYSYITGDGLGNRAIWYRAKDGKVTNISVNPYCSYAG